MKKNPTCAQGDCGRRRSCVEGLAAQIEPNEKGSNEERDVLVQMMFLVLQYFQFHLRLTKEDPQLPMIIPELQNLGIRFYHPEPIELFCSLSLKPKR